MSARPKRRTRRPAVVARFASRIEGLAQSDIRRMSRECERAGGINLGQGICDQPVPDMIKDAAIEAISADQSIYSKFEGVDELRRCIARKMTSYNKIPCDPDSQVVVTVGSTGGFVTAFMAAVEPGDEVILFSPFYGYHLNILKLCGASVKFVTIRPPDWSYDPAELAAAFTDRTKAIVINTPSNPCGKVFTRDELSEIAALCQAHDVVALTDEIYEYILYDGHEHVSIGSLPGMADRTITLSGFSKTYNMTGWRLGYAVGPAPWMEKIGILNDLMSICAPTPLQHALVAAFDLPPSYYNKMRADYAGKLRMIEEACEQAGLTPLRPQGAYYLLVDAAALGQADDTAAARYLLDTAGVATVPGSSFYANPADGNHQVRICFAKQEADLEEACRRLARLGAGAGA
ncbi:MAG: pyridoxal phosphate-dependent aminotransferase [Acidobacteriota bacterium]